MEAVVKNGKIVVTCTLQEVPAYIAWIDSRDNGLCDAKPSQHTDPERIRRGDVTQFAFQFSRVPSLVLKIDGTRQRVSGQGPIWTSPFYIPDCELMDLNAFKSFAESSLEPGRYATLEQQLEFQRAETWTAIMVVWLDREERLWRQYEYKKAGMIPLDTDGKPVTFIKTFDGEKPLPRD